MLPKIKFIFFDLNHGLIETYQKHLNRELPDAEFIQSDVRQIDADVYVSPANSYGWMDGGIDDIYRKMFPGIQSIVRTEIAKNYDPKFNNEPPFLPIGSAVIVECPTQKLPNKTKKLMICAPTMETPSNIEKTPENICKAMMAILESCEKFIEPVVVAVPGLGTGCGEVSSEESARQILLAIQKYKKRSKN